MKCLDKDCDGELSLDLCIEEAPYYEHHKYIELDTYCSKRHSVKNKPFNGYDDILAWVEKNYDRIQELDKQEVN